MMPPDELRGRIEALTHLLRACQDMVQSLQKDLDALRPDSRLSVPIGLAVHTPPVEPPDPSWVPILHRFDRRDPQYPARACQGVGVYVTEPPREGINADIALMRILYPGETRWRQPDLGDLPVCSTCHAPIEPFSNTDLDYLSQMLPAQVGAKPTKKPRARRRSGEDRGEHSQSGSRPMSAAEFSPVSNPGVVDPGLPSTFAGHTPEAMGDILEGIQKLQRFAHDSGLFDDQRLQRP